MVQEYDLGYIRGQRGDQGAQGLQGVQGPVGPCPYLSIGTVETLAPQEQAYVQRRADSPDSAPVFDFGIPRGAAADMQQSVYDTLQRKEDIYAFALEHASAAATIVVAAANSKYGEVADYVCTGQSDQLVLREAVAALPESGGRILLLEGDYYFDSTGLATYNMYGEVVENGRYYYAVPLLGSHIDIAGMGPGTRLYTDLAQPVSYYYYFFSDRGDHNAIHDLVLDGGMPEDSSVFSRLSVGGIHGVDGSRLDIYRCYFSNCSALALMLQGYQQVFIHECTFDECALGNRLEAEEVSVCDNYFGSLRASNVYMLELDYTQRALIVANQFVNEYQHNSGTQGLCLSACDRVLFANNLVLGYPNAIYSYNSDNLLVCHNIFGRKRAVDSSFAADDTPLHFINGNRILVIGNDIGGKSVVFENCVQAQTSFSGDNWNV